MQVGFYFDQTRCTGCGACGVACKDHHDIPAGPENWMRVRHLEKGLIPNVFVSYLIIPCWQCLQPVCMEACPSEAITKRAWGRLRYKRAACLHSKYRGRSCICSFLLYQTGQTEGRHKGKP